MAEKIKSDEEILKETLALFGIDEKYLLSGKVYRDAGVVVMVTHGGKKIKHKIGEKAEIEPTYTEITGNPPKEEMIWSKEMNRRFSFSSMFKKVATGIRL